MYDSGLWSHFSCDNKYPCEAKACHVRDARLLRLTQSKANVLFLNPPKKSFFAAFHDDITRSPEHLPNKLSLSFCCYYWKAGKKHPICYSMLQYWKWKNGQIYMWIHSRRSTDGFPRLLFSQKWQQKVPSHCLPPPPPSLLSSARHIFSLAKCHVSKASRPVTGHRTAERRRRRAMSFGSYHVTQRNLHSRHDVEQCQMESWR